MFYRARPVSVSTTSGADRREVVAALLDDDRRQPELAEDPSRLAVAGSGHLERALGVAGRGVDAERDDERARRRRRTSAAPGRRRASRRRRCPAASGRLRFAVVVLRLEAEEVGEPAGARVDVHGRREHVAPVRGTAPASRCRGARRCRRRRPGRRRARAGRRRRRGVVEVAGAAVERARDVVARRAAACVRERFAVGDEVDGGERDVDRGARRLPGARADQRHRVVGEESRPRPDRGGRGRRASARQLRRGRRRTGTTGRRGGRPPTTPPTPCAGTRRAPDRARRAAPSRRARRPRPPARRPPTSASRIASARAGTSVAGVRVPTQTSASGSWRRQSSLQTNGSIRVAPCHGRARTASSSARSSPGPRNSIADVGVDGRPRHGRAHRRDRRRAAVASGCRPARPCSTARAS